MKKKINSLIAMLLISCLTVPGLSINVFAAPQTGTKTPTSLGIGQTSLYQDGALGKAYSSDEAADKYSNPEAGTYEDALYQALKKYEDEIDISKYKVPVDEAIERYKNLINANPELFFVSNAFRYNYELFCDDCGGYVATSTTGEWILLDETFMKGTICNHNSSHNCRNVLMKLLPTYIIEDKTKIATMTNEFDKAAEEALAGIDSSMSDLEKALYCHDYIVKLNAYDYENYTQNSVPDISHTAYGALVRNVSVCDGYSLAYIYLLKQCGIRARLVTSDSMNHAWNAVELDGNWYFLDLTHDDPVFSYLESDYEGDHYSYVGHMAFLASEELWTKTQYGEGNYRGWAQTDIKCTDTKYDNAIWKANSNEYAYCDGYWYYLDRTNAQIRKTENPELEGDSFLSLRQFVDTWPAENGGKWSGIYTNCSVYAPKKQLYFNVSDTIYRIVLTDASKQVEKYFESKDTVSEGTKSFFGMIILNDRLYYGLADNPHLKEEVFSKYLGELKNGDANGDGQITTYDALLILKIVVGIENLNYEKSTIDVDKNGQIEAKDALLVLKYIATAS